MRFNEIIIPNFILRILSDPKKHWTQNRVSFAYLANETTESIINFHHNDAVICPVSNDLRLIDTYYAFPQIIGCGSQQPHSGAYFNQFHNAELAYWFKTGKRFDLEPDITITRYWAMGMDNVNDAVPIMRWITYCRQVRDLLMGLDTTGSAFSEYESFILNLRSIEKKGLNVVD